MARLITVAGTTTGIPDVYQNKVVPAGAARPGILESGVVAIVGPCEGTIQPKVPYPLRNGQNLQELLGSGELYDAARFAFSPSRDDPQQVRGASKIIAVRANPALQGDLTLVNGSSADLIDLTSVGYGVKANEISVAVDTGTDLGPSKKLTVSQLGESDEVGDNIGFNAILIIRYTGNGSAAIMTINATSLATTLTAASDGSADLNVSFSTYNTIAKLVAYIDSQTGYSAEAITAKADTYLCSTLDYVTAVDILTATASVTVNDSTTSMTMAGLVAGDVVKLGDEHVYVGTAGAPNTVVRGYNDTSPAAHTAVTAQRWYGVCGVNQAMIEWVTNYSARLYAERATGANTGTPATLAETYLSNGTEGSIGNTDWQDSLKALRPYKYNFIVLTSTDATPQGYLKTHLEDKWGLLGQEAVGHVGTATDATKAQIITRAKALKTANISLWFDDVNRPDDAGVDTNYPPWALAVMAAGIQAGSAIGTPLTYKSLNVTALNHNSNIDINDDIEDFIVAGVSVARYDGDEYRIVRCLSTWVGTEYQHLIAPNVRSALAWTVYKVRDWVRLRHLGKKAVKGNAKSIQATARTALEICRDVDESIVDGSKLEGGRVVDIPAFQDIVASQNGNVVTLTYKCTPVDGTDFVIVNTTVVPFQDYAG